MDPQTRAKQIQQHLDAIAKLEGFTPTHVTAAEWPPKGYYMVFHVLAGMTLGFIGAAVSLLANVIGAPLAGRDPLELIRVYLTFPMGDQALQLSQRADAGLVLTVGCGLYLVTGAAYGVVFHVIMSRFFATSPLVKKWIIGSIMGLVLWLFNFYLILSWLQPLLQGKAYIVEMVPFWVAAVTHLAFAWTMLLIESWGRFDPGSSDYFFRPLNHDTDAGSPEMRA